MTRRASSRRESSASPLEARGGFPDFHAGVRARRERGPTDASARDDAPAAHRPVRRGARGSKLFVLPAARLAPRALPRPRGSGGGCSRGAGGSGLVRRLRASGGPAQLRRFVLEPDAGVLRLDLPQTKQLGRAHRRARRRVRGSLGPRVEHRARIDRRRSGACSVRRWWPTGDRRRLSVGESRPHAAGESCARSSLTGSAIRACPISSPDGSSGRAVWRRAPTKAATS
jgi:hypothetical protein